MQQENSIVLATDPGRPSKLELGGRFARYELGAALQRLSRKLGFTKLHEAVPEDWAIPDSEWTRQAIEYANNLCPEFMLRHCFRSYCFGAILGARNNLKLDREIFFVSAMLHDLGLSDTHAQDPGSFEWVGAQLAHDYCINAEQSAQTAATVHNAIALHTAMGVAGNYQPEIALLHFGTAMDLFGMRLDEVPADILQTVLNDYPRNEFKAEFSPCLHHQAEQKPDSQIAGAGGIGILDRIQATTKQLIFLWELYITVL